ncbi:Abnormal spindle-like microcephaly-associated [Chionoecetes opilio]|uniref:Abnormal spindle-like microcephaly-associated n=1 Tax=Chionoecetes opilio TaxID=41210 RepID=A0A8J4Y970_CHIOP|nr:Abnormal spindle-like microcephaly-associated [Chionoecetes opilio]
MPSKTQARIISVSFCGGRALCLLLHHYYPDLLPRDLIHWDATRNIPPDNSVYEVSQLDGVPLLRSADTVNTIPDKRRTATFLAHLCARLLDLTAQIKAVLQLAWQRHLAHRRLMELRRQHAAAVVEAAAVWQAAGRIQRCCRHTGAVPPPPG